MSQGGTSGVPIAIPPQLSAFFGLLTNLSATAVIFWIVLIEMPKARQDFREESKEMRDGYGASIKDLTASINKLTDELDKVTIPR